MELALWQALLLTAVGVVAGFMNVMAGGGSLLTVPVMVFMGLPGPVANGTNRIAILAQNIPAVYTFFRKGFSDFKLSLSLSLTACLGAVGGAWLGVQIEGVWFDRLLAAVMIGVMVLMAMGKKIHHKDTDEEKPRNLLLGHLLMIVAGFWGGMIQIGVGLSLIHI